MKCSTVFRKFLVLMFAILALSFTGCSDSSDDDDGGEENATNDYNGATAFTVSVPTSGTKYFSFAAGLGSASEKTADKDTTGWDIAFTNGRLVLTNSGDTAGDLTSSGAGGVWFTGWTAFKNLTELPAGANFSGAYATDTKKSVNASASSSYPEGQGMPTTKNNLNVMTYIGYGFGNGLGDGDADDTDGDSGAGDTPFGDYQYNASQFYVMGETMGAYSPTMRVYIIKHGDGSGYTEVQITAMETAGTDRVYTGYYQTIP
jgi:hypothetical protein